VNARARACVFSLQENLEIVAEEIRETEAELAMLDPASAMKASPLPEALDRDVADSAASPLPETLEQDVADSAATADDPEPSAAALPRGWESATSRSTGRTYYINLLTNESTYDVPTGPALGAEMERDQPLACGSPSSTSRRRSTKATHEPAQSSAVGIHSQAGQASARESSEARAAAAELHAVRLRIGELERKKSKARGGGPRRASVRENRSTASMPGRGEGPGAETIQLSGSDWLEREGWLHKLKDGVWKRRYCELVSTSGDERFLVYRAKPGKRELYRILLKGAVLQEGNPASVAELPPISEGMDAPAHVWTVYDFAGDSYIFAAADDATKTDWMNQLMIATPARPGEQTAAAATSQSGGASAEVAELASGLPSVSSAATRLRPAPQPPKLPGRGEGRGTTPARISSTESADDILETRLAPRRVSTQQRHEHLHEESKARGGGPRRASVREDRSTASMPAQRPIQQLHQHQQHQQQRQHEQQQHQHTFALPRGWESATSRSTGRTYYINLLTNESTYDVPTGPALGAEMERDLLDQTVAAEHIQAVVRGTQTRQRASEQQAAAVAIQSRFRGNQERMLLSLPLRTVVISRPAEGGFGLSLTVGGESCVVESVRANSAADAAGIRAGDCITRIGEAIIVQADDAEAALGAVLRGDDVEMELLNPDDYPAVGMWQSKQYFQATLHQGDA
jgi:hypothetical protein